MGISIIGGSSIYWLRKLATRSAPCPLTAAKAATGCRRMQLVMEAKANSGSLITAGFALEMGKAVFALPGPVTEELSLGCHKLIYDGAGIAYSPEVILEELGVAAGEKGQGEWKEEEADSGKKNKLGLARDLNLVYSCLDLRPKSLDEIIKKTGLAPETASRCTVELTLLGWIAETGRHYYVKVK